jgi:hypothetical protein
VTPICWEPRRLMSTSRLFLNLASLRFFIAAR